MKQASARRSFFVFNLTMTIVLLLAMGIYASNRLLTQWLLVRSIDQTVVHLPAAIQAAGLESEFSKNLSPSDASASGLRLSMAGEPTAGEGSSFIKSQPEMSTALQSVVASNLMPSTVLDSRFLSSSEFARGREFAAELAPALVSTVASENKLEDFDVEGAVLQKALERLESQTTPFSLTQMTWSGELKKYAYVVIPYSKAAQTDGALIVLVDNSSRIESLSMVTLISSGFVTVMCVTSFCFAGFLLWMRFHDQVKTNRDIEFLAHHDALTGLPNRAVFNAKLNEALRLAHAKASNMGVMLIDVDKFKDINDTYGHGTGDIFLQIIADRLRAVFSDHLVARLSGDEFAIMVQSVSDVARLTRLASGMIAATEPTCVIDGKEIKISLSIGIARASDGSWRASRLLHCADLALYRAKHSGRSTFAWYTAEMDADALKRKEIEAGLVKALKFDQFELLFQPQYSLIDNKLKGYESLIRWEHPEKGTISPETFIPIAEESGLIEGIGDWVLARACSEAAGWADKSLVVAVNVSAAQFMAGETHKKVERALRESGLEPTRLEIEITESLLISNTDAVVETLNKIRAMGVSIAMDDFGTGYSSLSYLSRFPFDKIKIDRSFISNLGQDIGTDAIVTSIIGLGRSLDVLITAEGVENQNQVTLLRAAGCNLVQGYLFGRPGSVKSHEEFMERSDPRPAMTSSYKTALPAPSIEAEMTADQDEQLEITSDVKVAS